MKKKIFFLIFICAIFIGKALPVQAEVARFYEAEYIDDIYINRIYGNDPSTIHYQKARFFRKTNTNEAVYCVDPTREFVENTPYTGNNTPISVSDKIKQLAYFGYLYPGHEDPKWYAITQVLIWRTADTNGNYYFTDGLNGNYIEPFNSEIDEIYDLINKYNSEPNLDIPQYVNSSKPVIFNDLNNTLHNYSTSMGIINNDTITFEKLDEGEYSFELTRTENKQTGRGIVFYSAVSQNIYTIGNIPEKSSSYKFKIVDTKLTINKKDSETKSSNPRGKATIEGTVYSLIKDGKEVNEIKINKDGTGELEGLDFGKYILKEKQAGAGYQIDEKEYEINITGEEPKIELNLEDDVIKKTITIHKVYGDKEFVSEVNAIFNIYDENNNFIDSISTDENGNASIELTYGTYSIKQLTGKEGYEKVLPLTIEIKDTNEQIINLKDYKIKVPNTYSKLDFIDILLLLLELIVW